jgi:hypothetical protein
MLAQELNRRLRLDLTMVPIGVIRRYPLKKILLLTTNAAMLSKEFLTRVGIILRNLFCKSRQWLRRLKSI